MLQSDFGVRGRGQKMGLFSCNFAEPFFEVFLTWDFFLGAPRRLYACVVVVRNLDFLLFSLSRKINFPFRKLKLPQYFC